MLAQSLNPGVALDSTSDWLVLIQDIPLLLGRRRIAKPVPESSPQAYAGAVMALNEPSDADLVHRFKSGDASAFETLFRRYEAAMYRLARARVPSDDAASDVVQEAFLKAYRAIGKLRDAAAFRPWLSRICLNVTASHARSALRRLKAEAVAAQAAPQAAEPPASSAQETSEKLQSLLSKLPRLLADTLLLREVEGLSYKEIARAMRSSEKAVEMRLLRARKILKRELAKGGGHDEL